MKELALNETQLQIRYPPSNEQLSVKDDTRLGPRPELFAPIPGWPYEVSSFGRVRRTASGMGATAGRFLGGGTAGNRVKYPTVMLADKGRRKTAYRHRLVAEAFLGPIPDGMEVDHLDGNPLNCRLSNLCIKTPSANIQGAVARGHRGERRWNAKFTENDIVTIRERRSHGMSVKEIAAEYAVSTGAIYHIIRGHNWRHVA